MRWDFPKAEQTFRELADLRKKTVGERDPLYADSLVNLANVLRDLGRFPEAADLARAQSILIAARGDRDPSYGAALRAWGGS